jgi:hypothetical protein
MDTPPPLLPLFWQEDQKAAVGKVTVYPWPWA